MNYADAITLVEKNFPHGPVRGQTFSGITGTVAAALASAGVVFGVQYPAAATKRFALEWLHLHYVTLVAYTTPVTAGRRLHLKRGSGGAYTTGTDLDIVRNQSDVAAASETALVGQVATTGALTTTGVTFETPVRYRFVLVQAGNAGNDYDEIWAPADGPLILNPGQSAALLAGQVFDAVGTWQASIKGGGREIL